jgi:hypothetical protein
VLFTVNLTEAGNLDIGAGATLQKGRYARIGGDCGDIPHVLAFAAISLHEIPYGADFVQCALVRRCITGQGHQLLLVDVGGRIKGERVVALLHLGHLHLQIADLLALGFKL